MVFQGFDRGVLLFDFCAEVLNEVLLVVWEFEAVEHAFDEVFGVLGGFADAFGDGGLESGELVF